MLYGPWFTAPGGAISRALLSTPAGAASGNWFCCAPTCTTAAPSRRPIAESPTRWRMTFLPSLSWLLNTPAALSRHQPFEHELLDPLSVLHLGHVEIALRVDVHVMHHIELAGRDAIASERVERLERLAVEHPHPRRAPRRDIEEPLLRIVREGRAGDGLAVAAMRRLAIAIDENLIHELAFEREHLH